LALATRTSFLLYSVDCDNPSIHSCVGVWQNDRVEIIPNEQGNRTTPSYVSFSKTERLIGDAAKSQIAKNPTNTVFGVKRLIGRKFDDTVVKSDIKHFPFKVENKGGRPVISVVYRGRTKAFVSMGLSIISGLLTCVFRLPRKSHPWFCSS
jgi:molecular chaperone DnaK (HSP70)